MNHDMKCLFRPKKCAENMIVLKFNAPAKISVSVELHNTPYFISRISKLI